MQKWLGGKFPNNTVIFLEPPLRGAIEDRFCKTWSFWPTRGGRSDQRPTFLKICKNKINLCKWSELWWNTQYINGEVISHQFMRLMDPYIPQSQPKMQNKHTQNLILGDHSPVRYPCFLIEWIFHRIEYSQFLLFE